WSDHRQSRHRNTGEKRFASQQSGDRADDLHGRRRCVHVCCRDGRSAEYQLGVEPLKRRSHQSRLGGNEQFALALYARKIVSASRSIVDLIRGSNGFASSGSLPSMITSFSVTSTVPC